MQSLNVTGGRCWRASGRNLDLVKRWWRLLVALAAGLLLSMLYAGSALEALVPKQLYYLGLEKNLVLPSDGGSNNGNSKSDASRDKTEPDIRLLELRKHREIYDQHDDVSHDDVDMTLTSKNEGNFKENVEDVMIKIDTDSPNTSQGVHLVFSTGTTFTTTQHLAMKVPTQDTKNQSIADHKKILFYTKFFSASWDSFLLDKTAMHKCPVSSCTFLQHSSNPEDADAVIFHATDFIVGSVPARRRPEQLYVWLNLEAPKWDDGDGLLRLTPLFKTLDKLLQAKDKRTYGQPGFFNWTMTYHRASNVMLPYGAMWPLAGEGDLLRPALLDKSGDAYMDYMKALKGEALLQGEREAGKDWATFLTRPKLVAWMVSHCHTASGRELYVEELRRHIEVDVFGACGKLLCTKEHMADCYTRFLRPTYKFYLAFENNMCDDYITEKVWLPLLHGLVPVVYGGARYSDFLPPHSYVDATLLPPIELARLLSSIGKSSEQYGRYHLWRKYWKAVLHHPLCEICYMLHRPALNSNKRTETRPKSYHDLRKWWWGVGNCSTRYPKHLYPRPW